MRYLFLLAASACLFTWMACGNGASADTTNNTQPAPEVIPTNSTGLPENVTKGVDTNKPITIVPAPTVTAGLNPAHGQPGHRCDIAVGAPLNSAPVQQPVISPTVPVTTSPATQTIQPTTVTAVAPGMNPAHGQPGHRCDIAVGAPLDSKPIQQPVISPTVPVTSPATQTIQPTTVTAVAPGMNPAHGQPGHRCDIAVGAPLNSAPVQQPVTKSTLPLSTPTTQAIQPKTVTTVAPGMNPPHGQPGHRCDIAVGAPLNSPQTTVKSQPIPTVTPITPAPVTNSKQKQ